MLYNVCIWAPVEASERLDFDAIAIRIEALVQNSFSYSFSHFELTDLVHPGL